MTKEQIAKWVGRIFILLLAATIVVMVFGPDGKKEAVTRHQVSASQAAITKGETHSKVVHFKPLDGFKDGQIAAILDEASKKRGSLVVGIVHCHVPGNPESEQLADSLNAVAKNTVPKCRSFAWTSSPCRHSPKRRMSRNRPKW
jgi:hypothetical protein